MVLGELGEVGASRAKPRELLAERAVGGREHSQGCLLQTRELADARQLA